MIVEALKAPGKLALAGITNDLPALTMRGQLGVTSTSTSTG